MYELFSEIIRKARPTGEILQAGTDNFSNSVELTISDYWDGKVYTEIVNLSEDEFKTVESNIQEFNSYTHEWF